MATIALAAVGGYVGGSLFSGVAASAAAAAVGSAIGGTIGNRIDNQIFGEDRNVSGPQLQRGVVGSFDEGGPIPYAFGSTRLIGTIIWATNYLETSRTTTQLSGGKGGGGGGGSSTSFTEYFYSGSFAVALCHGPISGIGRIWMNNELYEPSDIGGSFDLHIGGTDQMANPFIITKEYTPHFPEVVSGYRNVSYIVFKNLPLEIFGDRYPVVSVEVINDIGSESHDLTKETMSGVVLGPGSGNGVYSTESLYSSTRTGIDDLPIRELDTNNHISSVTTDVIHTLDRLEVDFPDKESIVLEYNLFVAPDGAVGPGLFKDSANIFPIPTYAQRGGSGTVFPSSLVITDLDYEGFSSTPSDAAMKSLIKELSERGYKIILHLKLNIIDDDFSSRLSYAPVGNISVPFQNSYAGAITSAAWLFEDNSEALEAVIIGSQMKGLTSFQLGLGQISYIERLMDAAREVKRGINVMNATNAKVSYCAHYTELQKVGSVYPLDELWADDNIDFVGVAYYPPLSNWREGDSEHKHIATSYNNQLASVESGEGWDFIYNSDADRANDVRTSIETTPELGVKRLYNWWNTRHEIDGQAESHSPWVPRSKPIWILETGCPSIDLGSNEPFHAQDPRSIEYRIPVGSDGSENNSVQRNYIQAIVNGVDRRAVERVYVGSYDLRPFPYHPGLETLAQPDDNYETGHAIAGKFNLSDVGFLIQRICNLSDAICDISSLSDANLPDISGYLISNILSPQEMLGPIVVAMSIDLVADGDNLTFRPRNNIITDTTIRDADIIKIRAQRESPGSDDGITYAYSNRFTVPDILKFGYFSINSDDNISFIQSEIAERATFNIQSYAFPFFLNDSSARIISDTLLYRLNNENVEARFNVSQKFLNLEPGDYVELESGDVSGTYRINNISHQGTTSVSATRADPVVYDVAGSSDRFRLQTSEAINRTIPTGKFLNLPRLTPTSPVPTGYFAGQISPRGAISVYENTDSDTLVPVSTIRQSSSWGTMEGPLPYTDRQFHDRGTTLRINLVDDGNQLISRSLSEVIQENLNFIIIDRPRDSNIDPEIIQFTDVALVERSNGIVKYDVSGIIRHKRDSSIITGTIYFNNAIPDYSIASGEVVNVIVSSFMALDPITLSQNDLNRNKIYSFASESVDVANSENFSTSLPNSHKLLDSNVLPNNLTWKVRREGNDLHVFFHLWLQQNDVTDDLGEISPIIPDPNIQYGIRYFLIADNHPDILANATIFSSPDGSFSTTFIVDSFFDSQYDGLQILLQNFYQGSSSIAYYYANMLDDPFFNVNSDF